MLEAVTFDTGLTTTARVLYLAVHVRGRDAGVWNASHAQIAQELRLSERDVRRRLAELQEHGYLRTARGRVSLEWAFPQDIFGRLKGSEAATVGRLKRPQMAGSESRIKSVGSIQVLQVDRLYTRCVCGNPFDGPEPARCECGRVHYPEQAEALEPLPAVAEILHGYVRSAGLEWAEPDQRVCSDVLAAAGGVAKLLAMLKGLYGRRLHPKSSYAWFLTVANQRRTA